MPSPDSAITTAPFPPDVPLTLRVNEPSCPAWTTRMDGLTEHVVKLVAVQLDATV
jgi:hypothetical protein